MTYIGVDIGTTRIKAVCYDPDAEAVTGTAAAPTPTASTAQGDVHVPGAIMDVVAETISALTGESASAVQGVAVASVGEEVVLLDEAGAATDDVLTWYNPAGRACAARLAAELRATAGWPSRPDASFSLFKLAWLHEHRPWAIEQAISLTDLGGYVTATLAGLDPSELIMDWSHASRTGFFDPRRRAWTEAALAAAGISAGHLPRLVPSGTMVGTLRPDLARRWGMGPDVAICAGGHDHFCAAYACDVRDPGELFVSAGTSEAHMLLTDALPSLDPDADVDVGCFVDDRSFYLHRALPSGHLFRQWYGLLFGGTGEEALYREVGAVRPGSDGVRCRISLVDWRLAIECVPADASRGTLMRALFEAFADIGEHVDSELAALAATPVQRLVAAGEPVRQPVWRQLRAMASSRPITFVSAAEPTATGAALLAQRGATETGSQKGPEKRYAASGTAAASRPPALTPPVIDVGKRGCHAHRENR